MKKNEIEKIAIFEGYRIRREYDEKKETWWFSLVDVIAVLTDSVNPTDYLKKLRKRDKGLGLYLGTNCPQVEMNGRNRQEKKNSCRKPRAYSSTCPINPVAESRTVQNMAGQSWLRENSRNRRSGKINQQRTEKLATLGAKRKMDSAKNDGARNKEQAD